MNRSLEGRWRDLRFGVRKSSRYHERRKRFFLRCNRGASFVSAFFGTAAAVSLLAAWGDAPIVISAVVVAVAGLLDLVVGTAHRAWEHGNLCRDFILLERRMVLAKISEAELAECIAERLEIEAKEPPTLRVLSVLAHNDVMRADGYPPEEWARVTSLQRRLAPLMDFRADRLEAG